MPTVQELALLTANSAEVIARHEPSFDATGADLAVSNMAVIADRLSPGDFSSLSQGTQGQVAVIAHVANELAPLSEEDARQHPDESDSDYEYRLAVWQPIHSFQRLVHTHEFDSGDDLAMSKIRFGVEAAGRAFESVLLETKEIPEIAGTERYFWGNALAAARRAKMLAEQSAR